MTAAPLRLEIDWTRCDGHGLCHALLPGRIAVDEWGFPIIIDALVSDPRTGDADLPAARRTVATCPALALRLETPAPSTR